MFREISQFISERLGKNTWNIVLFAGFSCLVLGAFHEHEEEYHASQMSMASKVATLSQKEDNIFVRKAVKQMARRPEIQEQDTNRAYSALEESLKDSSGKDSSGVEGQEGQNVEYGGLY